METLFSQLFPRIQPIWSKTSSLWRKVPRQEPALVAFGHRDQTSVPDIVFSLPLLISFTELCTSYRSLNQQRKTWTISFLLWISPKQTFSWQATSVKEALAVFTVEFTKVPVWQPNPPKAHARAARGRKSSTLTLDQGGCPYPSGTRFRSWRNCNIQMFQLYWDTVYLIMSLSWSWSQANLYMMCCIPGRGPPIFRSIESRISGTRTLSMSQRRSAVEWHTSMPKISSIVMWKHKISWCPVIDLPKMRHLAGEHGHAGLGDFVIALRWEWRSATLALHPYSTGTKMRSQKTFTRRQFMLGA